MATLSLRLIEQFLEVVWVVTMKVLLASLGRGQRLPLHTLARMLLPWPQ